MPKQKNKALITIILITLTLFFSLSLNADVFESEESLKNFLTNNGFLIGSKNIDGVPIFQLKVLVQGASHCGYHAIKNILFTKDFVDNPIKQNLDKLTNKPEYDKLLQEWDGVLNRSDQIIGTNYYNTVKAWYKIGPDEMRSVYVPVMLKDTPKKQLIDAYGDWSQEPFSNLLTKTLPYDTLTQINKQFSRLQAEKIKTEYYGVAFSSSDKHWMGISFVKIKDKKYAFCFDSNGNPNQLDHAIVKFLTSAFAINETDGFIKKYFTTQFGTQKKTLIPALIQEIQTLADLKTDSNPNQEKLLTFMTDAPGSHPALEIISKSLKPDTYKPLKEIITAELNKENNLTQLKQAISNLKKTFNAENWEVARTMSLLELFETNDENFIPIFLEDRVFRLLGEIEKKLQNLQEISAQALSENIKKFKAALESLKTKLIDLATKLNETKKGLRAPPDKPAPTYKKNEPRLVSKRLMGTELVAQNMTEPNQPQKINSTNFYDVKVFTQCDPGPLQNIGAKKFRNLYGCGFHSLKNVLFLTSIILAGNTEQLKAELDSAQTFTHYFEAPTPLLANRPAPKNLQDWQYKWDGDTGNKSWYYVWEEYRKSKNIPAPGFTPQTYLDDPPTQDHDLENLKQKIITQEALAPAGSVGIAKNLTIIEYIDEKNYLNTTLSDAIKLLKLAKEFEKQDTIILPFQISYTHKYSTNWQRNPNINAPHPYGKTGRHWIAVVINKYNKTTEVFFTDSWRYGEYVQKNLASAVQLFKWIAAPVQTVQDYAEIVEKALDHEENIRYAKITEHEFNTFKTDVNALYPGTLA
ncbi:MAG: hypothetical protein ABH827_03725 [bacterium]